MPRPLSNRPYLMADGTVEWPQYRDEVPDIGPKAEVVVPERPFPWSQTFAVLLGLAAVAAGGALFWRRQRRAGIVGPLPLLLKKGMERVSLTPPRWLSRWAYLASLKPIARSFEVINQSLCWLKSPPRPSDTPAERAAALAALLPDAAPAIQKLLHLYHETYYGPRLRAPFPAWQAAAAVRRLVVRAVLKDKLAALKRKLSFFSR